MTRLEAAIHLACRAHRGQLDADRLPHIVHCMEVMLMVKHEYEKRPLDDLIRQLFSLEDLLVAAILHDTVEDSEDNYNQGLIGAEDVVILDTIRQDFGEIVADIVDGVSRRIIKKGKKTDKEFYRDLIYRAKDNPGSAFLKTADLLHNISRNHHIPDDGWRRKLAYKYPVALRVLAVKETSWEYESCEFSDGKYFIASPNGRRIEITKEEFEVIAKAFSPHPPPIPTAGKP